ncbi:MAG TPA: DegT/DnrJ/EryC1/StrS family aminotransferase, partial [Aggregatilineales bacterium]|nr:DegT/DnrJ/EryC1/StrS family aminotransferase [Aggregatilineales bacterium]
VQGLGGSTPSGLAVGTLSEIAFTSFHPTKMIPGYGGAVATDDDALWEAIQRIPLNDHAPSLDLPSPGTGRLRRYRSQIQPVRAALIRPFDPGTLGHNVEQIQKGWQYLSDNVTQRNERAALLHNELSAAGLHLLDIRPGDSIWRLTFAAHNTASANWIARHLQSAGLPGSRLYPSLSGLFAPGTAPIAEAIAPRLVNLWVDHTVDSRYLQRVAEIVLSAPRIPLT